MLLITMNYTAPADNGVIIVYVTTNRFKTAIQTTRRPPPLGEEFRMPGSKYNNAKIVISEVYASFVLQCTVSGR